MTYNANTLLATSAKASSRRKFLKRLASTGAATIVGTSFSAAAGGMRAWAVPGGPKEKVLVSIFLRGGADGLNMFIPHGDPTYHAERLQPRASLVLPANKMRDLDGLFAMNKALDPLLPFWNDGRMTAIHAVGSKVYTKSHFVGQPNVESGLSIGGWMQRAIGASPYASNTAGVSIGDRTSPQLAGPYNGTVVGTIEEAVEQGQTYGDIRPALEGMYARPDVDAEDSEALFTAVETIDTLTLLDPAPGVVPENNPLAASLSEAAQLIKGDIGVRCIAVDSTGWDMHDKLFSRMEGTAGELSEAIASFMAELGEDSDRVLVSVTSEFGRAVRPNGSAGAAHGYGGMMFFVGDALENHSGGKVLTPGGWPTVARAAQYKDTDLQITTDFRSVYAEIAERHLGVADTESIFPGFAREDVGLLPYLGDANLDGDRNIVDALLIARYSTGIIQDGGLDKADDEIYANGGDINGDGNTDIVDALLVAKCSAGITGLGVC